MRASLRRQLLALGDLAAGLALRPLDLMRVWHSGLLDPAYYHDTNPDVSLPALLHFTYFGGFEGRDPGPGFDSRYYMGRSGVRRRNPLVHYLVEGRRAGLPARPTAEDAAALVAEPFRGERIAVYTVLTQGYDELLAPEIMPDNCDFFCFTDDALPQHLGWRIERLEARGFDPARAVRYYKTHPHRMFPHHSWSIWVDANLLIRGDVSTLISRTLPHPFGAFLHPVRECVYDEAAFCARARMDDPAVIARQIARYRAAGMPRDAGLTENNVLVRRHHDPVVAAVGEAWWAELCEGSRRDQLSLPFVAHQLGLSIGALAPPGFCARNHPLFEACLHRHQRRRPTAARQ